MRQRRDHGRGRGGGRDLSEAGEAVVPIDVHRAGAADTLPAGAAEGDGGVDLVLDLDEGVKDHGAALAEIDLVALKLWLLRLVGIPPVDGEGLGTLGLGGRRIGLGRVVLSLKKSRSRGLRGVGREKATRGSGASAEENPRCRHWKRANGKAQGKEAK